MTSSQLAPHYMDRRVALYHGDSLEVLASLPDACVDAVVTDPPYELGFMGRSWDSSGIAYSVPLWRECLRVLKPGGHLLSFGGTRTAHRMACAIEDAGFEIRDSVMWIMGSGFPKSLDVSKAIDRARDDRAEILAVTAEIARLRDAAGLTNRDLDSLFGLNGMAGHWCSTASQPAVPTVEQWARLREVLSSSRWLDGEVWRLNGRKGSPGEAWAKREVIGERTTGLGTGRGDTAFIGDSENRDVTAPATDEAKRWQGWGTALKPAVEPVVVARKPLGEKTVAANVVRHGTGALNIDACRVPATDKAKFPAGVVSQTEEVFGGGAGMYADRARPEDRDPGGRWPPNVVLDGAAADELDAQTGTLRSGANPTRRSSDTSRDTYGDFAGQKECDPARGADSGGASRFFPVFRYQAKAPTRERPKVDGVAHSTVKPLELMRWLVRLVTQPGGLVLEPFAGSGTTVEACILEGFRCIAIEQEATYLPLILERVSRSTQ